MTMNHQYIYIYSHNFILVSTSKNSKKYISMSYIDSCVVGSRNKALISPRFWQMPLSFLVQNSWGISPFLTLENQQSSVEIFGTSLLWCLFSAGQQQSDYPTAVNQESVDELKDRNRRMMRKVEQESIYIIVQTQSSRSSSESLVSL